MCPLWKVEQKTEENVRQILRGQICEYCGEETGTVLVKGCEYIGIHRKG